MALSPTIMIQVQLRPKGSHLHILPVVVLYLLVIAFVNIEQITEQKSWLLAAAILSATVIVAIGAFYFAMAFLYMMNLKESWFGRKFFGLVVPSDSTRSIVLIAGLLLTYFGFVCRIWMLCGLEAAFLLFLSMTMMGTRVDPSTPPQWFSQYLLPLMILIATIHTWLERRNLGTAGLKIVDDRKGGWL